ncbi:hypothetical protein K0M31_018579 [Melipona bicolor]|uniref:Uncharacterized protein n=1 Tax=Melipona bicolor TaxID=60889 RepID=A0AA40KRU4_9HYME|nr:hypothetical protein K0M31_018579 [Melipona bicolor]
MPESSVECICVCTRFDDARTGKRERQEVEHEPQASNFPWAGGKAAPARLGQPAISAPVFQTHRPLTDARSDTEFSGSKFAQDPTAPVLQRHPLKKERESTRQNFHGVSRYNVELAEDRLARGQVCLSF